MKQVDVLINAFIKPHQTALALLSLERVSGQHIDTVYFLEENPKDQNISVDPKGYDFVLDKLSDKIVHYKPNRWNYCFPVDYSSLDDIEYRHSIRYQYGWEKTDKDYVLIIHNDTYFYDDVIGAMLDGLGEHTAIGHIGQCWYCPAAFIGNCDSESYMNYRPSFEELSALYKTVNAPQGSLKRAYHIPRMHEMFHKQPWPLPECRVNEWCALVDMRKARDITVPHGRVTPFGAIVDVGKQILDVGCQWFRDIHLRGHTCGHFDIYKYMHHDVPPTGQPTLLDRDTYRKRELQALDRLRSEFGHP